MKEDFQEVPPIQKEDTLEEENAYRAPVTEKEETEKESKEDSNRKSAAGTQSKAPIVRGVLDSMPGSHDLSAGKMSGLPYTVIIINCHGMSGKSKLNFRVKVKVRESNITSGVEKKKL
eukprot:g10232.t1